MVQFHNVLVTPRDIEGSIPSPTHLYIMFNIGDLIRHKERYYNNDIGLIVDYRFYSHFNNYQYTVEWSSGKTRWYFEKEISNMFILIS